MKYILNFFFKIVFKKKTYQLSCQVHNVLNPARQLDNTIRVVTGQEKSGKTEKNDRSQVKMGVFEKSQENVFKKYQILSVQLYQVLKAFEW